VTFTPLDIPAAAAALGMNRDSPPPPPSASLLRAAARRRWSRGWCVYGVCCVEEVVDVCADGRWCSVDSCRYARAAAAPADASASASASAVAAAACAAVGNSQISVRSQMPQQIQRKAPLFEKFYSQYLPAVLRSLLSCLRRLCTLGHEVGSMG
jgi:hypothetical protein